MPSLLCIDPSDSYVALVSKAAAVAGFEVQICQGEQEGSDYLAGKQPCSLVIVANKLSQGEGVHLIRNTRMLAHRAAMPIIFVMSERDLDLAQRALQAGATEIFQRSDTDMLTSYINECAAREQKDLFTGQVLVVEDSSSQAAYLKFLCQALGLEVDLCKSVEEGMVLLRNHRYQLAIIDVVLEGSQSGLALLRHIRQLPPPFSLMPVIVMSGFDDVSRRIEALRSGASDYLTKPFVDEEFVWRLCRVMQNSVNTNVRSDAATLPQPDIEKWQAHGLSVRESEVCEWIMRGYSDKQVAAELSISFWTVRTHIGNIFAKLGIINRRELVTRFR